MRQLNYKQHFGDFENLEKQEGMLDHLVFDHTNMSYMSLARLNVSLSKQNLELIHLEGHHHDYAYILINSTFAKKFDKLFTHYVDILDVYEVHDEDFEVSEYLTIEVTYHEKQFYFIGFGSTNSQIRALERDDQIVLLSLEKYPLHYSPLNYDEDVVVVTFNDVEYKNVLQQLYDHPLIEVDYMLGRG